MVHNNIDNELHAWLTFLCSDEPEMIEKLIKAYPFFTEIYQDIAHFRADPREVASMFSEALRELDHNTEIYMIEEVRKERDAIRDERDAKQKKIERLEALLKENGISYEEK